MKFPPVSHLFVAFLSILHPAAGAVFPVSSGEDSGPGTLRQAILDANTTDGLDEIRLDVPVIRPLSPLPQTTGQVIISSPEPTASPCAVEASGLAPGESVITVAGENSTLRGIKVSSSSLDTVAVTISGGGRHTLDTIHASALKYGIVLNSDDNIIKACVAEGATSPQGGDGIRITGSRNAVIGGYVSGNRVGIHIVGGADNTLGVENQSDWDSTASVRNAEWIGIHIDGGRSHKVYGSVSTVGYGSLEKSELMGGLVITGDTENILVEGASIDRVRGCPGILVAGAPQNLTVTKSIIRRVIGPGISLEGIAEGRIVVDGNRITSCDGAAVSVDTEGDGGGYPIMVVHNTLSSNRYAVDVQKSGPKVFVGSVEAGGPGEIKSNSAGGIIVRDSEARVAFHGGAIQPYFTQSAFPREGIGGLSTWPALANRRGRSHLTILWTPTPAPTDCKTLRSSPR